MSNFKDRLAMFQKAKKDENKKITNKAKNSGQNKEKENNFEESTKKKDSDQLLIGKLNNGKHPIYGSKQISEIKGKNNNLTLYDYPLNIDYSSKEEAISILFIGQSGVGKSTFINAYLNHLLGITDKDTIRYKLIFNDESKENIQSKNQTDIIKIYNIRSPKYFNKLFTLIETPGFDDIRNENENQLSKIEQEKKEKEILEMYTNLFSKEIGKLNSITFVVKSSENRFNKYLRKIINNITNLFAGDIGQNFLSILTHSDGDDTIPDAVQVLEKMDIFKKKNNEDWYFPVSSTSYFKPFKIEGVSLLKAMFNFTEESFINYTKKILSLNICYTKQSLKYLELIEEQDKLIKILSVNILDNLLKIKESKEYDKKLNEKDKENKEKNNEINRMKEQIEKEDELKIEMNNSNTSINTLEAQINNQAKIIENEMKQIKDILEKKRKECFEINSIYLNKEKQEFEKNSPNEEKLSKLQEFKEEERQSKDFEKIKDIEHQIEMKKKEINTKIKEKKRILVEDTKFNLICESCESNCHLDCDCFKMLLWNPAFACELIKEKTCIKCYHSVENHKKKKMHYKSEYEYKSLSPDKVKKLENEISELEGILKLKLKNKLREAIENIK